MIPKIIHYCWLSDDPYPDKIRKCIESWHQYLPDYEFILWNRTNFDIDSVVWTKQAFDKKKYAFAADYIRAFALKNYGGIYLDLDVEVLKPFDDLLKLPYFIGLERYELSNSIEAAVLGAEKNHPIFSILLEYYENRPFILDDGQMDTLPLPNIIKGCLKKHNYHIKKIKDVEHFDFSDKVVSILPSYYFSPKDNRINKIKVTSQTYSIHHFEGSWTTKKTTSFPYLLQRIAGDKIYYFFIAQPFFIVKDYFRKVIMINATKCL